MQSVIWFAAAGGGFVAAVAGLLLPRHRRFLLTLASGLFVVAGVLGIFSVGVVVLLVIVCGVIEERSTRPIGEVDTAAPTDNT